MSVISCFLGFISGSLRLILFIASIIFVSLSIGLLVIALNSSSAYDGATDSPNASLFPVILLACYCIITSLFGLFSTVFRGKNSTELYALLAVTNVMLALGVTMYSSPRLADESNQLASKLQDSQALYLWVWPKELAPDSARAATHIWDQIQSELRCCGLKSPEDWHPFRPLITKADFPPSCCTAYSISLDRTTDFVCTVNDDHWAVGCESQLRLVELSIGFLLGLIVLLNLALSVIGALVILFRPTVTPDPAPIIIQYAHPSYSEIHK